VVRVAVWSRSAGQPRYGVALAGWGVVCFIANSFGGGYSWNYFAHGSDLLYARAWGGSRYGDLPVFGVAEGVGLGGHERVAERLDDGVQQIGSPRQGGCLSLERAWAHRLV
jgi:hypothetical protein